MCFIAKVAHMEKRYCLISIASMDHFNFHIYSMYMRQMDQFASSLSCEDCYFARTAVAASRHWQRFNTIKGWKAFDEVLDPNENCYFETIHENRVCLSLMNTIKGLVKEVVTLSKSEVFDLASLSKKWVFAECARLDSYHMGKNYWYSVFKYWNG